MTMKTRSTQGWLLGALGAALAATGLNAAPFVYNAGDLLLGIQSSGPNEMVVDLGQASTYYSGGFSGTVGGYDVSQITSAFGGLDNLSISVFGGVSSSGGALPQNTLFLTQARTDINTQTDPWLRKSSITQGNSISRQTAIQNGTVTFSGQNPPGVNNTATAVVMPSGTALANNLGANGNFSAAFQGDIQGNTGTGFAAGSNPLRLDLYELQPGAGNPPGAYLGYFDFSQNGSLSFTAVPEPSTWAFVGLAGLLYFTTRRLRRTA